ncbi:hypothetical protein [Paraburkholderia dinghuensis]|uniref:Uncharacterized protein n=1 Tax=Paraburkholderia dinghuensis TaxID=2305225 RepID=A0A3N6MCJ9_9BURK|nr:hypothetical protein [Paraburkholderia dinghuensis]RQH01634.1 hypothetical protein D1Y85_22980 [Paraburkholderia dinghuensis]
MKPSTIELWRAYLFVASLAAALIQVAAFFLVLFWRIPQDVFTSSQFRLGVVALVACSVVVVRRFALNTFHSALASRHARFVGDQQRTVALSPHCPRRLLVKLHVRFNRQSLDPALY